MGWNLTPIMQPSVQFRSDFFPRNGFDLAGFDLADSSLDFLCPCSFDVFVGLTMQAFEETTREFCPISFGK